MPTAPSCVARGGGASRSYAGKRLGRYNRSMVMAGRASAALEQLLDVGELELDISRAAVIALARERRLLHVAKKRVHLNGVEAAPCTHAAVAGHGGKHMVKPLGDDETALALGKLVGEIAHQALKVALAEQSRDLAHDDRRLTEGLDHETEPLEVRRRPGEPLGGFSVELDHFGDQQHLAGEAAIGESLLQALIDQPLMGRVLIDDNKRIFRLGDDEGVVHLRPRRAEGKSDGAVVVGAHVGEGAWRGDWG